jgi:FlaA1/EpsC-like NDP-sugar epimerase
MLDLGRLRGRHLFVLDLAVVLLAIAGALILRFDTFRLDRSVFLYFPAALLPLAIRPPINALAGLYSRAWAYASVGELARIAFTVLGGSLVIVAVMYFVLVPLGVPGTVTEAGRFPRSFFVLEGLLTLAGYGGVRFLIRAQQEWGGFVPGRSRREAGHGAAGAGRVPTLVYGAGTIGATVLRTIAAAPDGLGMRIVGLIDDDRGKRNQVLRGAKVLGGIEELPEIARVSGAHRLLIAIPRASGEVVRRAVEQATAIGLETRTVPALDDLVSGRLQAAAIREVQVEDLLRRAPVEVDDPALREMVAGKTVLVTGAGGSIGSELARQVFDLDPAVLVLLDRSEGALYEIERELTLLAGRDTGTEVREGRPRARLVTRLANVASLPAMARIFAEDRPALVFHAAAYKHVPMMELHPADAAYTNVGGTVTALRASLEAHVERFVLVSTDKAVEPSSVMGASKRLAELAVEAVARESGQRFVAVRFGNVLGSSGSVVPLFQRQLREGVPLTVTHPEMTRYFMTIPEASRLILQASLIGEPGDLFVLDMGEPIRIVDLALDLARLAGRDPASVPIEYVGLRPGEKLHETLFYSSETAQPTSHPKVLRTRRTDPRRTADQVLATLDRLVAIGATNDHDSARAAIRAAMSELDPDSNARAVA